MDFWLQFGYGMMGHSRELLERWGGGTVVLSPRDLTSEQLIRLGTQLKDVQGGHVLVDPQLYLPHSVHERLASHEYWPQDYDSSVFWEGPALAGLLDKLATLNRAAGARAIILPGMLAQSVNEDWLSTLSSVFDESLRFATEFEVVGTLALSAEAMRQSDSIGELLEAADSWPIKQFYIVCEHPNGDYLVRDVNWLASVLDLIAGLRLMGRQVVLGYSNHQMLITACSKVTAIASGTWMNVRAFPPEKFETKYDEEIKQRATWYYCPQSLSEYKLPYLDLAHRQKMLSRLAPGKGFSAEFVDAIFRGPQPSSVGLTEQQAFRHYLDCLRTQAQQSVAASFDETVQQHSALLDDAELLLDALRAGGVLGQMRDFSECIEVNRAALQFLTNTRGPMLRRQWSTM